jgi:hypothetical protein
VSPDPEYRYTINEAYLRVAAARYSAVQPARRRALERALPIALYLGLACWIGWSFRAQPTLDALYVAVVTLAFWYTWRKERRKAFASLKGTPLENASVLVKLGPDGLEIEAASTRARCTWGSFLAARFFDDGLLLLDGSRSYRWLPNDGLSGVSREAVEQLLRQKVRDVAAALR